MKIDTLIHKILYTNNQLLFPELTSRIILRYLISLKLGSMIIHGKTRVPYFLFHSKILLVKYMYILISNCYRHCI